MNEEQKEWQDQLWKNFGANEFLRFGCLFIVVQLAGIALSFVLKNFGIALISIALTFGVLWLAPYWQPAYTIFHKMMDNKNIPAALPKVRRKWWEHIILYIIVGIKLYILLAVLFMGIKLIFSI